HHIYVMQSCRKCGAVLHRMRGTGRYRELPPRRGERRTNAMADTETGTLGTRPGGGAAQASGGESGMLRSEDPRTEAIVGEYPVHGAEEVAAAVGRARTAAHWWDAQGFRGRRDWLREFARVIARGAD